MSPETHNLSIGALGLMLAVFPPQSAMAHDSVISASLSESGHSIYWTSSSPYLQKGTCVLQKPASLLKISFDKEAIILSGNEYINIQDLKRCGRTLLKPKKAPPNIGTLVDINVRAGLLLSLDPISTSPLSFLATISRTNSSKNLVNLPGAYIDGVPIATLQEQGFSYDPNTDQPKISPNGTYAAPNGEMDCSEHAYPGVWHIKRNQRVIMHGAQEMIKTRCAALFSDQP